MAAGVVFALTVSAAVAQPPAAAPGTRRVEEVRIIRGGPGGGPDADVLLGGPDLPWIAMGGEPGAVLDDTVKDAPFTAEAVTESTQTLSDGNRIVRNVTTSMARDGQGRTRREQPVRARFFSSGQGDSTPGTMVTITDPVSGQRYLLDPEKRTARTLPRMFFRNAGRDVLVENKEGGTFDIKVHRLPDEGAAPPLPPPPPPPPADGARWVARDVESMTIPDGVMQWTSDDVKVEDLGQRDIEGVVATGTRRVVTIEAGAIGNELPIQIVSERWYSPELKTVVLTKRSDPRMGEHTYRLTNIVRGEPDPSLFQVPGDYTVQAAPEPRVQIERRVLPPPPQP